MHGQKMDIRNNSKGRTDSQKKKKPSKEQIDEVIAITVRKEWRSKAKPRKQCKL